MERQYFLHPNRFPGNADGPFYTTGHNCLGVTKFHCMMADCLQCEAPEHEAPELLAPLNDDNLNTYFIRQPTTQEETERACNALRVCCVAALRYGGTDRGIIQRLGNSPEYCDYIIDELGSLKLTVGNDGELLPFARSRIDAIIHENRKRNSNGG